MMKLEGNQRSMAILIGFGLMTISFFTEHDIYSDAQARFAAIKMLMETGRLSDVSYSMLGPLFSVPLWLLGYYFASPEWWLARYNLFLFIGFLASLWFIGKNSMERKSLLYTLLVFVTLSLFIPYQKNYMGEIFTAALCGAGILLLSQNRTIGWLPLVIGTANTPATLIGLGLVALYFVVRQQRLLFIIYPIAAFLLIISESYIRRGGFFVTGYEANMGFQTILPFSGLPGFSYPFFFGVLSILFSFGVGLFFFIPGLWLLYDVKILKANPFLFDVVCLSLLFLVGEILVYSRWWAWYGGFYWGPRFFLIATIPASLLIANAVSNANKETLWKNSLTAVVVVLSAWVVINGTVFDQRNLSVCSEYNYQLEFLCWYVPEYSVLIRPFIVSSPLTFKELFFSFYIVIACLFILQPLVIPVLRKLYSFGRSVLLGMKRLRW